MRTLLALPVAALALAACGDDEPAPSAPAPGVRQEVATVVERYAAAVRARDATTICDDLLASSVRKLIERAGGDCERDLVSSAIADGGPRYRIAVRGIAVRGDEATVRTRVTERDGARDLTQLLVRERGRWMLTTAQAEDAP